VSQRRRQKHCRAGGADPRGSCGLLTFALARHAAAACAGPDVRSDNGVLGTVGPSGSCSGGKLFLRCSLDVLQEARRHRGSRQQQTTRWALGGGAHALRRRKCRHVRARRRMSAASREPACARAEPSALLPARVLCGRLRGKRACSRGCVAMRRRLCSRCCGADAHLRRVAAGGWRLAARGQTRCRWHRRPRGKGPPRTDRRHTFSKVLSTVTL
jgi:hypothetical protein